MSTIANQVQAAVASEARTHTRFIPDQGSAQALAASTTISKLESPASIPCTHKLPVANSKQELDIVPTFNHQLLSALRSPTQGSATDTGDSISLSDFPHPPQNDLARIRPEFLQGHQNQQPVASTPAWAMRSLQPSFIQDIDIKKERRKIHIGDIPSDPRVEPLAFATRMESVRLRLRRGRGASESSESDDMTHTIPGAQVINLPHQMKTPRVFQNDIGMTHNAGMASNSKPRTESNNVVDAPTATERSNAVMEEPRIMRAPSLIDESYAMGSASGSTSIIRASRTTEGRNSTVIHAPRMVERSYAMMHGEKFVPISSSPSEVVNNARTNEIDHDEMDDQDHARATHLMEWLRITTSGQIQNLPIKSATSEDDDIIRAPRMTPGSYTHSDCSKPISASTVEQASTISDDSIGGTSLCPPPPPTLRTMDEPTTKLLAKKLRKVGESAQARKMLREQAKQAAASGAQSPKRRSFTELVSSASRSDLGSKVVGIFHMRRGSKSGDSSSSSTASLRVATPEASRGSFARPSMEFCQ